MDIVELGFTEWRRLLPTDGYNVFHTPDALRVLAEHAPGELHLFGGFKGDQPVALLPLFIRDKSVVRIGFSPPPGFGIRRIGPILMPASPKQSKQERVNRQFTAELCDVIQKRVPTYLFISAGTQYTDPRPFQWEGYDVTPLFTYQLDLGETTPAEVLGSFSKSLRREIRNGEDADITISRQGSEGARKIYETTRQRYAEQGLTLRLSWEFVRDLMDALESRMRVYVAESAAGEFLGGIIVLYSTDTAYFWKGGTRSSYDDISVNSLLHWRIITDIIADQSTISTYDFHTANNERITQYKNKFGGSVRTYYRIESSGVPMTIAKKAYRKIAVHDSFFK